MVPPLVHYEKAIWRDGRQALGSADVVAERLFDEDGNAVLESTQDDLGVRRDRCYDDNRIDGAQAVDLGHDRRRATFLGSSDAGLRSRDDLYVAPEHPQVAQNVHSPEPAADLPDDHGRR
jgi:hypothetical protein